MLIKRFTPSAANFPIIGFQSRETRALTVGYLKEENTKYTFIPCRLNLGQIREEDTYKAAVQTLCLSEVKNILLKYKPTKISTITVLRETLACRLNMALSMVGVKEHFGDSYIGASHVKEKGRIKTSYLYENIEGLTPDGLWIIADSIAAGRNLRATLISLLSKFHPNELLIISPIANRWGINRLSKAILKYKVPVTFVVWGALFGLNPENRYDEPWGLSDCEPVDPRDQETFVKMYGPNLCVGGDFGNDYYSPSLALKIYKEQLRELKITPKIPSLKDLLKRYSIDEFVVR